MRILQVISTFYPALAFGGPVKVVYDISKELAKRGHEVEVFATNAYDQTYNFKLKSKEQVVSGFKVTYFNNLIRFNNLFLSPEMIVALRKRLKEFDVVHTHFGRQAYDIAVNYYAHRFSVPYVLQAHGDLPRIIAKQRLKWIYDTFFGYNVLRNASKVIALSEVEAQQYRSMEVPDEKIAVIPNGIDLSKYAILPPRGSFKKKFDIRDDEKIVLYLGRIHKGKGIDFLINSFFYLLKNDAKNIKLVIAGPDDGYLNQVKCLVNSIGLDEKVLFTGMLSENDKIAAYVDSSVCTYLSMSEPFGLVSLEAAACETPIIVSIGTPMSQIVNRGKFGFSVNYGNVSDLSKKMNKLIYNDAFQEEMGRKGREFVFNNFSWNSIIIKLEKVYEEVTEFKTSYNFKL